MVFVEFLTWLIRKIDSNEKILCGKSSTRPRDLQKFLVVIGAATRDGVAGNRGDGGDSGGGGGGGGGW